MGIKQITEKITLPVAILLSAIILAIGFYAVQYNKQQSIEKQQLRKLEGDRITEEAKAELLQKEYVASRRKDCLAIFKVEDDKWNNIEGWRYSEEDDKCYIEYSESNPKSDAECDKLYPIDAGLGVLLSNLQCKDGKFENSF